MNEKLQYATMLEIPVNTCSVTFQPQKKKRPKKKKVDHDSVKQELVNKVNSEMEEKREVSVPVPEQEIRTDSAVTDYPFDGVEETAEENITTSVRSVDKKKKGKFKFSVIGFQIVVIGALIATIFLTNALYADSGINVFLREVFGTQPVQQADLREYDEFAPVIALDDGATASVADGVITLSGEGSVYASCDGTVTMITQGEDGKYTVEITHSQNFKSVLGGLDYAYAGLNDSVYYNIPVGYCSSEATMCFTQSDGSVISDYQIIDDSVVWAV